jgi:predicted ATPase
MTQSTSSKRKKKELVQGINGIAVRGYKSLYEESYIAVRSLTILAGANSSGKSSIMQPLLLMKQTLEATYDPGALLLNGPHVRFTLAGQLFFQSSGKNRTDSFTIKVEIEGHQSLTVTFKKLPQKSIELIEMIFQSESDRIYFSPTITHKDILPVIPQPLSNVYNSILENVKNQSINLEEKLKEELKWKVNRTRCFFEFTLGMTGKTKLTESLMNVVSASPSKLFDQYIRQIIHVPGLRGNPERTYNTTAIGSEFPGTFESYVASVINEWQKKKDRRIKLLSTSLETLGLTCKIQAKEVDDTQVELLVGRLCRNHKGKTTDMVSIADVGFGVSQTLPVLVALLVAEPGQLVYLEQPEIHLHPRAQAALAEILVDAANRGVRVVLETHSELLLLAVQSLVAEGKLLPNLVKLHWFKRRDDGVTEVSSADLDETGAFGDWPEDLGDVSLHLENRYLDAAEAVLWKH